MYLFLFLFPEFYLAFFLFWFILCLHLCKYTLCQFLIFLIKYSLFQKEQPSINNVKRIDEFFFISVFFSFLFFFFVFLRAFSQFSKQFLSSICQWLYNDKTIVEQVLIRFSKIIFISMLQLGHLVIHLNFQLIFC